MNENFEQKKLELIQWVSNLQDEETISEILKIKNHFENWVKEPKSEYVVKDDFEERWAKGVSHTEMKRRTKEYIENLPWKS